MKLPAVLVIVVFSTSVPASGFIMKKIKFQHFGPGMGRMIQMGGGGAGAGSSEPVDFEGEFTPEMRKLQRQVLRSHNRYRRRHGVHTLKQDPELDRYAQAWALVMAQRDRMQHRTNALHGENLYMWWSSNLEAPITGSQAVKSWYDEIKLYDFDNPGFRSGTGHFTQLVWKDSRRLGTGIARGPKGTVYIVSVYDPRGNMMGQFGEQVPRPVSGGGEKRRRRKDEEDEDDDQSRCASRRKKTGFGLGVLCLLGLSTCTSVCAASGCGSRIEFPTGWEIRGSNMKLVAVLVIAIFSASMPASGFMMMQHFNMGPPGKGGRGAMGGMGGGGPFEPTDFDGVFTRSMRKLQRQVLRSHNHYRRLHGVHTLKEDEELNRYAQAWALVLAQRDRMEHRTKPIHGENLYMWWSSNLEAPITGSMAVKAWYDEIKDYDYNNPTFKSGTGHFTQLVWKNCRRLGTGIARGRKGTIYIVSVYDPRGNIMGQFGSQVTRPNAGGGGSKGGHKKGRRQQQQDDY
nr:uncharacterized protein LOC126526051 [Dermacentor andersoni]